MKRKIFYGAFLTLVVLVVVFWEEVPIIASPFPTKFIGNHTVATRLQQFGVVARERWKPHFAHAQTAYPPSSVILVGLKDDKILEVYATSLAREVRFVRVFSICATSGVTGPKLLEGDLQLPEGIYKVSFLNPNSAYHVSLRLDYPNAFDRAKGATDGRGNLGGDIMIHGKCVSIGCLAMRDEPAEDLFVLAADIGIGNVKIILAPFDLRLREPTRELYEQMPGWAPELYEQIRVELQKLPRNEES